MSLEILRVIRKQKGLTLEGLSDKSGVNRFKISLIERGKANPLYGTVEKLAEALDLDINFERR